MPKGLGSPDVRDLLRELFQHSAVGVAVLDSDLRFVYINPALAEINGQPVEDHLGRSIEQVVPDLAPQARASFEEVLGTGQPLLGWELTGETDAAPGESRSWIEDIHPLFEDGAVTALGVIVVEITDRRRAEHELRQQRERAHRLLAQLERALTPATGLPRTWRAAWRYRAAVSEMLLGGDFLGVTERPDGSLEFLIGDVSGRGPSAAGIGASLRSGWRALVEAGVDPATQVSVLHRVLRGYGDRGLFATVCSGRFPASGSTLEVVSAGHHPPLRLSAEGHRPLELEVGPALGIPEDDHRWPTNVLPADVGVGLLLFTDGAFEGRRSPGSHRRLEYAGLADEIPIDLLGARDFDRCLDELLTHIETANGGPLKDDVALLLIGARESAGPRGHSTPVSR
jgi:PAS domain S-box-containing protein